MSSARPPITCHVLDTTVGLPGRNIPVVLTLLSPLGTQKISFSATTNSDGRVAEWTSRSVVLGNRRVELQSLFEGVSRREDMVWELNFEVSQYWAQKGLKAFFREVKVTFVTSGFKEDSGKTSGEGEKREHWHVPLLLGPFNYTTYRGS